MDQIISFLQGKRTYLISGCGLLVVAAWIFGVIDEVVASKALAALGFGGVITLRAATATQQAQTQELHDKVAALSRGDRSTFA
ncbi:MAG TPA: hypothetical protein PKN47_01690 [Nitrospira sp.]|nr:hypothetical protein [Nitrospira sp.]